MVKTTYGSKEAGGDGEYLVRIGTESRQHVMGHISLLGYKGDIIAPMTTGGPMESTISDPVGNLLTEWAQQCKKQGGVVVLPHFPRCVIYIFFGHFPKFHIIFPKMLNQRGITKTTKWKGSFCVTKLKILDKIWGNSQ